MTPTVLYHPQLRSALPRFLRRELCSSLRFVRSKMTYDAPSVPKEEAPSLRPKYNGSSSRRTHPKSAAGHAKTTLRRGAPEKILIYHGGTGRTLFIGVLRITTIFLFGVSCLVVAPAFMADEFPSYLGPAIAIGGSLPMLFVSYTSAPYVNFVHLALPISVRRSREQIVQYAKQLPPHATLYLNTMRFNTIPRQTEVRLANLIPDKSLIRPVTFRNTNPIPRPWWRGKSLQHFYTAEKTKPGKPSSNYYPELWEHVYKQMQQQSPRKTN